eukprot:3641067-Prorocentrum_lima.AAC.1
MKWPFALLMGGNKEDRICAWVAVQLDSQGQGLGITAGLLPWHLFPYGGPQHAEAYAVGQALKMSPCCRFTFTDSRQMERA